ncbi:hypothetical protein K438DRAFT_1823469 [Mycena galopus ATCC 62051]|nr:hypothetical protein K438DRAFT_1823469 [Mycena galopus ATCC 62051]
MMRTPMISQPSVHAHATQTEATAGLGYYRMDLRDEESLLYAYFGRRLPTPDDPFSIDFPSISIPTIVFPSLPTILPLPSLTFTKPPLPSSVFTEPPPPSFTFTEPPFLSSTASLSMTGSGPLKNSQTGSFSSISQSLGSSTSTEQGAASASFSSQIEIPHSTTTAPPRSTLSSAPAGTKHTAVIVGVLVPLVVIGAVIAILVHRRSRRLRHPFDAESAPDLPPNIPISDPPRDIPRGRESGNSSGTWSESSQPESEKNSSTGNQGAPLGHEGARTTYEIMLSRNGQLSRTPTFASTERPETPLPRYARPLPKLPTAT